ncbi:hypothetical protein H5410_046035 [Solanum commersonii]|uniref:Uncharacterized protein n=1 Tax=Solanum commersonii TaxID=4109 RepID=A0A9J5XB67_SOLCO|nr:hypothetical protein H5410_046035 [Solanum commersonii]
MKCDYGELSEINGQNCGNDVWVGQTPLRQQFPDIYNLNQQNLATISEVKMHKVGIMTKKLWQWFINLRGIRWAMPRHTVEVLACWKSDKTQGEMEDCPCMHMVDNLEGEKSEMF